MKVDYWQQYLEIKKEKQHFYPREAALQLGISEGELLLSNPDSTYLGSEARPIVLRLKELGKVLCIARNDLAVHEKGGVYENVSMTKKTGIALNVGEIDLRIFAQHWHCVIAVKEASRNMHSIQFFDAHGDAIQKIFLRDDSKIAAWQAIVDEFASTAAITFSAADEQPPQQRQLTPEELTQFHQRWSELKDIHHFGGILETFSLTRLDAYRQAPADHAFEVDNGAFEKAFLAAKERQIKIMIFVGNRGIVQIQSGCVHNVKRMHNWLNILDSEQENFSLHLADEKIAHAWVVRRPTRDGIITCLEGFNDCGKTVITIFGLRSEGDEEQRAWQEITATLYNS